MAIPGSPETAVLFIGILASDRQALTAALDSLETVFGPIFMTSRIFSFARTSYYTEEMGSEPLRLFAAFPGCLYPGELAQVKLATNRLESELAQSLPGGFSRPVNLDPGYLTQSKIILASAKDFSHRVYLANGIFAEVTLQYRNKQFISLPWTFPDYAVPDYHPFFFALRHYVTAMGGRHATVPYTPAIKNLAIS